VTLVRQNGLRTGQKTGQRNTVITPEMQSAQWRPGQSGNAGGRPKAKPISDELRALLSAAYSGKENRFKGLSNLRVLALKMFELAIAGDLRVMQEITDRTEGKVIQRQELGGPNGGAISFISLNREENEQRIAELLSLTVDK
jgi:Family of unknown function (DUF5681)